MNECGDDLLLNTHAAASMLGVSYWWLVRDRNGEKKIPLLVLGPRTIRYRLGDLRAFIASHGRPEPGRQAAVES